MHSFFDEIEVILVHSCLELHLIIKGEIIKRKYSDEILN